MAVPSMGILQLLRDPLKFSDGLRGYQAQCDVDKVPLMYYL
jgi:hypothetical protein